MTAAETAIREALAAGPTPGPWKQERNAVLIAIAPYEWAEAYGGTEANARLIAACNPANVAELLAELDGERNRSQMYADLVRGVAVVLHGPGWSDTSKLPQEVASLRAEVEALRPDAERYRAWRREFVGASIGSISALLAYASTPDDVDAAIDAAKGGGTGAAIA